MANTDDKKDKKTEKAVTRPSIYWQWFSPDWRGNRPFDRNEISEIVHEPYWAIKSWSSGKPLLIAPSFRAPGVKGSTNLYSLFDVYGMGVAAHLFRLGVKPTVIQIVVDAMKNHPEWTSPDERGAVLVYGWGEEDRTRISVFHISAPFSAERVLHASGSKQPRLYDFRVDLKTILDRIDNTANLEHRSSASAASGKPGGRTRPHKE